jgi:hypothetical protein
MQYGEKIAEAFALLIVMAILALTFSLAAETREPRLHATLIVLPAYPAAQHGKDCDPVCLPYKVDISRVGRWRTATEVASANATGAW